MHRSEKPDKYLFLRLGLVGSVLIMRSTIFAFRNKPEIHNPILENWVIIPVTRGNLFVEKCELWTRKSLWPLNLRNRT